MSGNKELCMNRAHVSPVFGEPVSKDEKLRSRGPRAVHWADREARGDFGIYLFFKKEIIIVYVFKIKCSFPQWILVCKHDWVIMCFALRGSYLKLN
jgi:hypothetical protein